MRVRFIKYGKTIRNATATEHAEVSVELERDESPDQAMDRAKEFINDSLAAKKSAPLGATIGERVGSQHFNGA